MILLGLLDFFGVGEVIQLHQ